MNKSKSLVQLIEVPKIFDDCSLIFAQAKKHIPFEIRRVFWIADADTGLPRGFHAHKTNRQILFCLRGSIQIIVDNGKIREEVVLDKPNVGIFFNNMIWHEMLKFQKNTVLLVLNSHPYDPKDYIRKYQQFLKLVNK